MNNIVIKGRLTKEPELNTTSNGKEVANFSVAVNRRFNRDETDFFDVKAWDKTGVFVCTYFKKGQEILIRGTMQRRKWQDKDGNNRYSWELIADEVEFCGGKTDNQNAEQGQAVKNEPNIDDFSVVVDDDLPF